MGNPKLAIVTEPHFRKTVHNDDLSNSELSVVLSNFLESN